MTIFLIFNFLILIFLIKIFKISMYIQDIHEYSWYSGGQIRGAAIPSPKPEEPQSCLLSKTWGKCFAVWLFSRPCNIKTGRILWKEGCYRSCQEGHLGWHIFVYTLDLAHYNGNDFVDPSQLFQLVLTLIRSDRSLHSSGLNILQSTSC